MTVWLRSSLLCMATKASALCGAPPSTPCCGCCFGALPSCTEGFTLGDPASPIRMPIELHMPLLLGPCCFLPPVPAAFPGALSLFPAGLRLLLSPRPFSFVGLLCCSRCRCIFLFVVWCPVASGLVLWVLVWFLVCFLVCSALLCLLSFCWWFGGLCWLLAH